MFGFLVGFVNSGNLEMGLVPCWVGCNFFFCSEFGSVLCFVCLFSIDRPKLFL